MSVKKTANVKVCGWRLKFDQNGPSIWAYDARGKIVNVICGTEKDSISTMRAVARKTWPTAKERF